LKTALPVPIKENEMGRECSTHRQNRNANKLLVLKPEEKRQLGRG
jgi:hypothetical protein